MNWNNIFTNKLTKRQRTYAFELRDIRHSTAHTSVKILSNFSDEEVMRALDTMFRFINPIDSNIAENIKNKYMRINNNNHVQSSRKNNKSGKIDLNKKYDISKKEEKQKISNEANNNLITIIEEWNNASDEEVVSDSVKWGSIYVLDKVKGVKYKFETKNKNEIFIKLGCWTGEYPNIGEILKSFEGLEINGYNFKFKLPPPSRIENNGWQGWVEATLPIKDINLIIDTMKKLIEQTREIIIRAL